MHRWLLLLPALFLLVASPAPAEVHVVTQQGISFNPQTVIIVEGDTVRWVWTAGSHTVTSGTGSGDPNQGALFDSPLTSGVPVFEYTFNTVGNYPYFCWPHEAFGMTGTVLVDAPTPTEPTTWGAIKKLYEDAPERN